MNRETVVSAVLLIWYLLDSLIPSSPERSTTIQVHPLFCGKRANSNRVKTVESTWTTKRMSIFFIPVRVKVVILLRATHLPNTFRSLFHVLANVQYFYFMMCVECTFSSGMGKHEDRFLQVGDAVFACTSGEVFYINRSKRMLTLWNGTQYW